MLFMINTEHQVKKKKKAYFSLKVGLNSRVCDSQPQSVGEAPAAYIHIQRALWARRGGKCAHIKEISLVGWVNPAMGKASCMRTNSSAGFVGRGEAGFNQTCPSGSDSGTFFCRVEAFLVTGLWRS